MIFSERYQNLNNLRRDLEDMKISLKIWESVQPFEVSSNKSKLGKL